MGKIVKFCTKCDEGFAEKFGFCPNCGASLQAFEMNPLASASSVEEPIARVLEAVAPDVGAVEPPVPEFIAAPITREIAAPIFEEPAPLVTETVTEPVIEAAPAEIVEEVPEPAFVAAEPEVIAPVDEPVIEAAAPKAVAVVAPIFTRTIPVDADRIPTAFQVDPTKYNDDDGFYVTVIEEKNASQRNLLLLGSFVFIVAMAFSATVYSLFNKSLGVYAIGDDTSLASLIDEVPTTVEEEKQVKADKNAGGGGGGGREEKDPASRGDLADQTPDPIRPPDVHIPKLDNPALVLPPASTQGNKKFDKLYGKFGDPNGADGESNGPGTGGGIGSGRGTGQGSGNGTGAGSGNGSGFGNGDGNGNGNGTGDGESGTPPPRSAGVTQAIKILSKPRPGYTDSARQANIQGTVILRVTFLGSGQIGSISPVKGLGSGLTEQAIAAARRISFEPMKVNGVGQTVTKQIEYTFSIY